MKKLSIIIPCYNEQDNIIPLFEKLKNLINLDKNLEIIIIDNGSTDNTLTKIKNHLFQVVQEEDYLHHPRERRLHQHQNLLKIHWQINWIF